MSATPKPRAVLLLDRRPVPCERATTPTPPPPKATGANYIVERGVPITGGRRRGLSDTMPFGELLVGDSFMVPAVNPTTAIGWCRRWGEKLAGRKFLSRKVEAGVRIWRTQ